MEFLQSLTFEEAIANDKKVLRDFFRRLVFVKDIDSYAMDYSEDDFRISIIKGKEEYIFRFLRNGDIENIGSNVE